MTIYVGSARIDENNKVSGGKAGDQTGKEVAFDKFYVHKLGWYIIRPKSVDHANKLASIMTRACNNDNIGYDQSNRLGVITYGTNTTTKTECDCSSLVRQCVREATGKDPGNFNTASERKLLLATGLFDDVGKYNNSTVYNGDILVTCSQGHTVIVTSGNARGGSSSPTPATSTSGNTVKMSSSFKVAGSAANAKAGKFSATYEAGTYEIAKTVDGAQLLKNSKHTSGGWYYAGKTATSSSSSSTQYYPAYDAKGAIAAGLKAIGVDSSYANREKIAKANGISGYAGTVAQNTKMCDLLKQGKLKKA